MPTYINPHRTSYFDGIRFKNVQRGIDAAYAYTKLVAHNRSFRLSGTSAFAEGFNRVLNRLGKGIMTNTEYREFHDTMVKP